MTFTKPMIDLVKEIRRHSERDIKPSIKLANPELFQELKEIFFNVNDAVIKALIKELFNLAGDPWNEVLTSNEKQETRQILKTYRGQSQLVDAESIRPKPSKRNSQKIYRGQPVID